MYMYITTHITKYNSVYNNVYNSVYSSVYKSEYTNVYNSVYNNVYTNVYTNVYKNVYICILLVGYPLTVIGGIIGKNSAGAFDSPCRTKNIARELPRLAWYKSASIQLLVGGFLPFR